MLKYTSIQMNLMSYISWILFQSVFFFILRESRYKNEQINICLGIGWCALCWSIAWNWAVRTMARQWEHWKHKLCSYLDYIANQDNCRKPDRNFRQTFSTILQEFSTVDRMRICINFATKKNEDAKENKKCNGHQMSAQWWNEKSRLSYGTAPKQWTNKIITVHIMWASNRTFEPFFFSCKENLFRDYSPDKLETPSIKKKCFGSTKKCAQLIEVNLHSVQICGVDLLITMCSCEIEICHNCRVIYWIKMDKNAANKSAFAQLWERKPLTRIGFNDSTKESSHVSGLFQIACWLMAIVSHAHARQLCSKHSKLIFH